MEELGNMYASSSYCLYTHSAGFFGVFTVPHGRRRGGSGVDVLRAYLELPNFIRVKPICTTKTNVGTPPPNFEPIGRLCCPVKFACPASELLTASDNNNEFASQIRSLLTSYDTSE